MMPAVLENELNVYESAEARFEIAAKKLNLEQGVYRYMKYPEREITVYIPVALDNGHVEIFIGYRVLHSCGARPGQRRHSLRAQCFARRSARPGRLDDLEMRGGEYSLWRREGRRDLRSRKAFQVRARARHAALHRAARRLVRPGARHSRSRHRHQRSDHGLGDGHLRDARAAGHHRGGHRQAARPRRLARTQGSHRARLDDLLQPGRRETGNEARRLPRDRPGIRQRGLASLAADASRPATKSSAPPTSTAASTTKRLRHSEDLRLGLQAANGRCRNFPPAAKNRPRRKFCSGPATS